MGDEFNTNVPTVPVLTLEPSMTEEASAAAATASQAVAAVQTAPEAQPEEPKAPEPVLTPEEQKAVDDFAKQIESESNGRGYKAAELLKQKLYKDAAPKQIKFEAWQLQYSFRTKEEAIDYVMMIAELFTKTLNMRSLSRFSEIDGMERIINMAIYLGCIDELIPKSIVSYKTVLETICQCSSRSEYKKRYQMNYRLGMHIDGLFDYFFGQQKQAYGFEKSP
jgi:hypothetical protein